MATSATLVSSNFLATRDLEELSSSLAGPDHIDLLYELEANAGRDYRVATERRVARNTEDMRSTYDALPKDESGRLGASGVRYLLHRLFVQRHGWSVKGLSNKGDAWNTSSPTEFIGTHMNDGVQGSFDKQLHTHGFDLHHVALLAATLENFVHAEAVERLKTAYRITGIEPSDGYAPEEKVKFAMQVYLALFVLHKKVDHNDITPQWAKAVLERIDKIYPTWNRQVQFLEEIRKSVLADEVTSDGQDDLPGTAHSWNVALQILERFGYGYGRWQNHDCVELKRMLVQMEESNTGRVPLDRFYSNLSSDISFHFSESVVYLKMLGAIDESDPTRVRVIIPNYLNGPNNCVGGSKFYEVCCIDECDALVGHLEQQLGGWQASPGKIAELVAQLPSDTVSAPRDLPRSLLQRLEQIADHHGGLVPLHGRLFSQWMHHAYPRECPYPHISGTTNPISPQTYKQETGEKARIDSARAFEIVNSFPEQGLAQNNTDDDLPWSSEEELFVCSPGQSDGGRPGQSEVKQQGPQMTLGIRTFTAVALPVLFCVLRTFDLLPRRTGGKKAYASDEKHYV